MFLKESQQKHVKSKNLWAEWPGLFTQPIICQCNKLGTWSLVWHINFDSDSDKMIDALLTWTRWHVLQVTTTGTGVKMGRPHYITCQSNKDRTSVPWHSMKNFAVPTHLITMGCTAAHCYLDPKMNHEPFKWTVRPHFRSVPVSWDKEISGPSELPYTAQMLIV